MAYNTTMSHIQGRFKTIDWNSNIFILLQWNKNLTQPKSLLKTILKDICHPSAHAQQLWFLIRRNIFQSWYMWEKSFSIDLTRRVKIVIPILKNFLVNHDTFKRHIFCLELKTVEKIRCPKKRIFKAARDESYV